MEENKVARWEKLLIAALLVLIAWSIHRVYVYELDVLNDGNHMIQPDWRGGI